MTTDNKVINWQVGQRAVVNRSCVVEIERVTPSGRVTAGGYTFDHDGYERGPNKGIWSNRAKLEPLTPEIEADLALAARARIASRDSVAAVEAADKWLRGVFAWGKRKAEAAEVEKAERLTSAIKQILGE